MFEWGLHGLGWAFYDVCNVVHSEVESQLESLLSSWQAPMEKPGKESDEGMATGTTEVSVGGFQKIMPSPFDTPATVTPLSTKGSGTPLTPRVHR